MNRDLLEIIREAVPYAEAVVELGKAAEELSKIEAQLDGAQREYEAVSAKARALRTECEAKKTSIKEAEAKLAETVAAANAHVEETKLQAASIIAGARATATVEADKVHASFGAKNVAIQNTIERNQSSLDSLTAMVNTRSAEHDRILASLAALKKGIPG